MTNFIDPAGKLLANLDRVAMLKDAVPAPPVAAEMDLSNRCSLGCSWCHFAYTHTKGPLAKLEKPLWRTPGGDLMDTDLALRIVDELAEAGVRSLTLTGGGEPTLHPDFDRIVEYAEGKLALGIYTHGGHIDAARAAILKRAMSWVYVSLDAANAEAYKRDKGVDRFDAATSGIRNLVDSEGEATIGVGYLITPGNTQDIWAAARVAKDLGADYIQYRPTIQYDQDNPSVLAEDTDYLWEVVGVLTKCERDHPKGFVQFDADRFRAYRQWEGHGFKTCWWAGLQTVITPNGKVWTCANKREHPDSELGDLSVESFSEIWARRTTPEVDKDCRVMCRGYVPNVSLDEMLCEREHPEFI